MSIRDEYEKMLRDQAAFNEEYGRIIVPPSQTTWDQHNNARRNFERAVNYQREPVPEPIPAPVVEKKPPEPEIPPDAPRAIKL